MKTPTPDAPLKIGTRGSPLALAQAHETRARLMDAHGLPENAVEIVVIATTGDRLLDKKLGDIGGKGLFTKEIEDALYDGRIDLAVHSMKDMPTVLPPGLEISCLLPREDVRDAFVSLKYGSIAMLPTGAKVGTASLRRQAQLLFRRPDLMVTLFRGNVQTRLRKLGEGIADATFLAMAGLRRLDLTHVAKAVIDPEEMLPACAQGAIGIETRTGDHATTALLDPLHDEETAIRLAAERAFLAALDGSCRTPIGGLATIEDGALRFRGEILRPDGTERKAIERTGALSDAATIGREAGETLASETGPEFRVETGPDPEPAKYSA